LFIVVVFRFFQEKNQHIDIDVRHIDLCEFVSLHLDVLFLYIPREIFKSSWKKRKDLWS
jgi:pantothenate kinase